jgi:anti-repressor protein
MNELIAVRPLEVGEETVSTVSGRDLHACLEVGRDFSNWIKSRIDQYGFVAGQDFVTVEDLSSPKRASSKTRSQRLIEYHLTLDMAKELSMVERTDKGKEARRYFIECERRAHGGTGSLAQALRAIADFTEANAGYWNRRIGIEVTDAKTKAIASVGAGLMNDRKRVLPLINSERARLEVEMEPGLFQMKLERSA